MITNFQGHDNRCDPFPVSPADQFTDVTLVQVRFQQHSTDMATDNQGLKYLPLYC